MKKTIILNKYFCLSAIIFFASLTLAAQQHLPIPAGNTNQLFYLQRTSNANTIVYELNYNNNILNTKDPIHVFWIRYGEQGQKTELSFMQRKFAYGVKSVLIAKDKYLLHFVCFKKFPMYLMRGTDNRYNIFTTINQKQAILNRIFVKINGGTFWSPNVEYVEVAGKDPATGEEVSEKMKI